MQHSSRTTSLMGTTLSLGLVGAYVGVATWLLPTWWWRAEFLVGLVVGIGLMLVDEKSGYRWYQAEVGSAESDHKQLITRSIVMGLLYLILAVVVVTSTTSLIGRGVVTSLLGFYSFELWQRRAAPRQFQHRFFWQIKRVITADEQRQLTWLYGGATFLIWLIQLRSL